MLDPGARALIFDIDGTLVDTMPLHFLAWVEASRRHGFPFDEAIFRQTAGMPAVRIVERIARDHHLHLDATAVARDKEAAFVRRIPEVRPVGPVAKIARDCHGRLPMSLGTGGTRAAARMTIEAAGLGALFPILVSSEDVRRHKPEPDTFLECARRMGIEPRFCQVFEDAELGLEAARRAGMIPCDVRPWIAREEPSSAAPPEVIAALDPGVPAGRQ